MEPSFIRLLPAIASSFKGWNLHTPHEYLWDLYGFYKQGELDKVESCFPTVHKHMQTFETADAEGKFWWECWQEFRQIIESRPKQTSLFD